MQWQIVANKGKGDTTNTAYKLAGLSAAGVHSVKMCHLFVRS